MEVSEAKIEQCTPGLAQEVSEGNLGFGNLYYALVRMLRPQHVLVIGSGYGFAPALMGLALADNGAGKLTFVDPSMSGTREGPNAAHGGTGQWDTPEQVAEHFGCAGVPTGIITHYRETNHEFFRKWGERGLPAFDLASVLEHLTIPGYVLMHDATHFLNRTPYMGVTDVLERARIKGVETVIFPGQAGLALMRFSDRPEIEIETVPPPSVLWPILGVLAVGVGTGAGGMWLINRLRRTS